MFTKMITVVLSPSHSLNLTGSFSCMLALLDHNSTDHSPVTFCSPLILPPRADAGGQDHCLLLALRPGASHRENSNMDVFALTWHIEPPPG